MGLFGSTLDLTLQPAEIITRVPHLQTEAKLVLGKAANNWYFVGWESWNGRTAVASSTQLRWVHSFDDYDKAEVWFYAQLEAGPKRFKASKPRDYQSPRIWRWWCDEVAPKAQPTTMKEVQKVVTKLYEGRSKPPPIFVQGSGRQSKFKRRLNLSAFKPVYEHVMFVQAQPTIPRVLLDTLWTFYGYRYSPELVLALMENLVRFAKYDRGELRSQVRSYRIKVAKKTK